MKKSRSSRIGWFIGSKKLKRIIAFLLALFLMAIALVDSASVRISKLASLSINRKSWKFPSLVYSDWGEWQINDIIPPERIKRTLVAHLFLERTKPVNPCEFKLSEYRCEIIIPSFDYPDGVVFSGKYIIEFDKTWRIESIRDGEGNFYPLVRIPPVIMGRIYDEDLISAEYKTIEQFPENLVSAVIVSEDKNFWRHRGFTFEGIIRAAKENIARRKIAQGGSSITQQLVKNIVLSQERSFKRKILELFWAITAEYSLDKKKILELYFNSVYLGQDGAFSIVGFSEASRHYFDKRLDELDLAECALLAGIIPAPSRFDPIKNPSLAERRRNDILDAMLGDGYITKAQCDSAKNSHISLKKGKRIPLRFPHFVDLVKREIAKTLGRDALSTRGLTVFTTCDPYLQNAGQEAVDSGVASIDARIGNTQTQSALVCVRVVDGKIVALVGGRSDIETEFNRALDAHRQPGSAFKIFVYASAIESAFRADDGNIYSPGTILPDTPSTWVVKDTVWSPRNYGNEYMGEISLRRALERSQNVATVYLAMGLGLERIIALAESAGIESPIDAEPSLALGAFEVTPFEMATAQVFLARMGMKPTFSAIKFVEDHLGNIIFKPPKREVRIMHENSAYVALHMLEGVIDFGRGNDVRKLGFKRSCAGKTGTTDNEHDSWFSAFTPQYSTAVWVGLDDNSRLGLSGTEGALPIWTHFSSIAHEGYANTEFEIPDTGLVFKWIDERTGYLAKAGCPVQIKEYYIPGTEQTKVCPIDHDARVDSLLNAMPTEILPQERDSSKKIILRPLENR